MNKITKKQENFLNECTKGIWIFNKDSGLIDIDGDFNCAGKNIESLNIVKIGEVMGGFDCSNNRLTSLKGSPVIVHGTFSCSNNKLTSLKYISQKIGGGLYCEHNGLHSMEYVPKEINGSLDCSYNQLVSLKGCPDIIGWNLNCSNNQLVSLNGCPKLIANSLFCDPLPMIGFPIDLLDKVYFHIGDNETIGLKDCLEEKVDSLDIKIYLKKMI